MQLTSTETNSINQHGSKDRQSLLAVSVLGIHLSNSYLLSEPLESFQ